jgi:hypothetical protein
VINCLISNSSKRITLIIDISSSRGKYSGFELFSFAAKLPVSKLKQLRLQREDFETLKIIGRGAFGEVCKSSDIMGALHC